MKIKHINNSFFQIIKNNINVVFDPWIGEMPGTATWSYPNTSSNKSILNNLNPELIYISHLHSDHYDEEVLSKYKKKNTKILIKNFNDRRLKNKILKLGYKKIIEVDAWKTISFKNFEFTIIPCDQSNSAGIDSSIFYDLDTSILVYDKISKTCFYNNVDNPLKINSIKRVRDIVKKKYKKIDIASFGPRSASEYPQCFINIDRKKEKNKIIQQCFKRTHEMLKAAKVKNFIPAGGSYCITGKFNGLQRYVAHPTIKEIKNYFSKKKINVFDIDNCGELTVENNNIIINKEGQKAKPITKYLKNKKYQFEKLNDKIELSKTFELAKKKYQNIINKIKVRKNFKINIYAYDNLEINSKNVIKRSSNFVNKFSLSNGNISKKYYLLECHLDKKLFYSCMKDRSNWNMALGGSSILFIRKPNKFIPDIGYSLNFLKI